MSVPAAASKHTIGADIVRLRVSGEIGPVTGDAVAANIGTRSLLATSPS